ncbi:MAG: DUF4102 domain-containing protein [Caldilineaceae bacterium SB0662_bin_9]|uniref:DUF4102 domain-containing protein n=1 Tax=Caldilineaceae bacterium SB0662_bin_9 TaxID=2605258 RepID=A0A6B1DXT3_9CHLR|nr:DUF4102 domain-containing protein [Caldilineaceae bacterium SB0662_bin_9]
MGKLTALQVKALSEPGRYSDGSTLYLRIAPGGSKQWVQRLAVHGVRRDIGLGGWPVVSLAEARRKAMDNRKLVADGGDPLAAKRRAGIPTFEQAAREVYDLNRPTWKNRNHIFNWWRVLEKYALPTIGSIPVDRVTQSDILAVLSVIWTSKPETARRVRQRIRTVLRWAMAHGFVVHNVAGEAIDAALPRMPKLVAGHLRAMDYREVAGALDTVDASGAFLATRLCLRFVVLTAARSGEARQAVWSEITLADRLWIVPADRMKAGSEHRVPLSDAALAVLEEARILRDESDLIFPSPQGSGRALSDMSLTKLLRDCGLADTATVHGFRTSFKVWAMECTDFPWMATEAALAHTLGNEVAASYARTDLLELRRNLMQRWANFLNIDNYV